MERFDGGSMPRGLLLTLFCLLGGLKRLTLESAASEIKQYCQFTNFSASCQQNEVVVMETARYGLMQQGRCVLKDYGHVGCAENVLTHLDSLCSGRHSCHFEIPDARLKSSKACPREFASYLAASYSCLEVETGGDSSCYKTGHLLARPSSGYLSSILATAAGRGTVECPWIIRAEPGQQINITLHDFTSKLRHRKPYGGSKSPNEVLDSLRHSTYCHKYAVIKEKQATRETVVCGGQERTRVVYISVSNQVEVHLAHYSTPKKEAYFLLHYHAIGCPMLTPPRSGWLERSGDQALLGCNTTGERWHLQCDGSSWTGSNLNCSTDPEMAESIWNVIPDDWSSPFGILIVSALGIALGLIIGVTMLSIVLVIVKRKKDSCLTSDSGDYSAGAQENDENNGGYVMQNKRNSATALMDHLEMINMNDAATYGATWRAAQQPFAQVTLGGEHVATWRPGRPSLSNTSEASNDTQTTVTMRTCACPAGPATTCPPPSPKVEPGGNRVMADLSVTCKVIEPHVYECPHFKNREHAALLLSRESAVAALNDIRENG